MRISAARRPFRAARSARGLSLIELMVALVIGSLLIAGAVSVYLQSRRTYQTNDTTARMQEVARYALDVIAPDVRLAGFWGLTNRPDPFTNAAGAVADDCDAGWSTNVAVTIEGWDADATGGAGYDLDCDSLVTPVDWSDVLIVRHAAADTAALQANRIQVQSTRESATLFSDGALPAGFNAAPQSETHNLVANAYYIGEGPTINGVRQFSLRRQTLGAGPSVVDNEIIPGVQDLQIQFGIDTNADGDTDRYVNPQDVPAGARIATVQVWVLVVSEEREIGFKDDKDYDYANANHTAAVFQDDRRRVLVTRTIQIRNSPT